jgi:hypothetical protein
VIRPAVLLSLLLGWLWPAGARAAVDRYAVLVGNNQGARDEATLRFAETDAMKLHDALKDLGGFRPEDMAVLRGDGSAAVRGAIIATNARVRASVAAGRQAMLLVFYSGHADAEALHLGDDRLTMRELEHLVRGSAANLGLLIVDACRSGALTQKKGGTREPAFPIQIERRLAGEGAVFLTSSAVNEEAQESEAVGGSFFTHYLVSGLLGAADQNADGLVSLDEVYRFTYESTLRASSRTLAGPQHPTFRYEMHGQGSTVLSTLAGATHRAQVMLPPGLTFLVTRDHAEGPVVAEVGALDKARRLSLRPGRYHVRGRARDHLLEGVVALADGQVRTLREGELDRVEYARFVRKGGAARPARAIELGYRAGSSLWSDGSLCHGLAAGPSFAFPRLTASARLGACRSRAHRDVFVATSDSFDLELGLWHEWDLRHATLGLGAQVGAGLVHQSFQTRGVAPARWTAAGALGAAGRVVIPVSRRAYGLIELGATTWLLRKDREAAGGPRLGAVGGGRAVIAGGVSF